AQRRRHRDAFGHAGGRRRRRARGRARGRGRGGGHRGAGVHDRRRGSGVSADGFGSPAAASAVVGRRRQRGALRAARARRARGAAAPAAPGRAQVVAGSPVAFAPGRARRERTMGVTSKGTEPFAAGPFRVRRAEERMLFRELAEVSDALAATRSRSEKIRILAAALRRLEPDERKAAVAWLSGALPGGRLGIGYAAIRALRDVPPAPQPALTITDVHATLDAIRALSGKGSG